MRCGYVRDVHDLSGSVHAKMAPAPCRRFEPPAPAYLRAATRLLGLLLRGRRT